MQDLLETHSWIGFVVAVGIVIAAVLVISAVASLVVRAIARRAQDGSLDPDQITEDDLERELNTAGIPDPDLLVRTAGEMRISNFLLWQISYAELYVTNTLWPDFDGSSLREAIRAYAQRERRFGS